MIDFWSLRSDIALHFVNTVYLRYQWFNLRLLLEATSTTCLMLHMCHGCVYTGSFVLDHHARYLQHFMSIHVHRIEIPYRAFPEQNLKALITLEQVNTSVVEKWMILMSKTSRFTGELGSEIGDWESGIGDQLKKLEMK